MAADKPVRVEHQGDEKIESNRIYSSLKVQKKSLLPFTTPEPIFHSSSHPYQALHIASITARPTKWYVFDYYQTPILTYPIYLTTLEPSPNMYSTLLNIIINNNRLTPVSQLAGKFVTLNPRTDLTISMNHRSNQDGNPRQELTPRSSRHTWPRTTVRLRSSLVPA